MISQKVVDASFLVVSSHIILVKAFAKYSNSNHRSQWLSGVILDQMFVSDSLVDFLLVRSYYWDPIRSLDMVISFSETN